MELNIIDLTENELAYLKPKNEDRKKARAGFAAACEYIEHTEKELWETVYDLFPRTKDKSPSIDWKRKTIFYKE